MAFFDLAPTGTRTRALARRAVERRVLQPQRSRQILIALASATAGNADFAARHICLNFSGKIEHWSAHDSRRRGQRRSRLDGWLRIIRASRARLTSRHKAGGVVY